VFILTFATSLMLMVYVHTSARPRLRSESRIPDDSIPLVDFKDLGSRKPRVLLLVTAGSAPQRYDRRQAIRDTWWKHCDDSRVKCVFVTDGIIQNATQRVRVIQERNQYKDLEFLPVAGGLVFGQRFLHQIEWAKAKFDFQYLLKIVDDYFLCLKRLLSKFPMRPKNGLVWTNFHCQAGIAWADEAFVIFSRDIIHKFLAQDKNKTLCHPFGDQTYHLWLNNMNKTYFHDSRLHHNPPASFLLFFENKTNVCDAYIGIHGTYERKMREFDLTANDGAKDLASLTLPPFSKFCATTRFNLRVFAAGYNFDPKPCVENPTWFNSTGMYIYGREKQG